MWTYIDVHPIAGVRTKVSAGVGQPGLGVDPVGECVAALEVHLSEVKVHSLALAGADADATVKVVSVATVVGVCGATELRRASAALIVRVIVMEDTVGSVKHRSGRGADVLAELDELPVGKEARVLSARDTAVAIVRVETDVQVLLRDDFPPRVSPK